MHIIGRLPLLNFQYSSLINRIMKRLFPVVSFLLFSFHVFAQNHNVENWNYPKYPDLSYELEHLELSLSIEPENGLISGVGEYHISSRRPHLTELLLNTANLEIQSIAMAGQILEYQVLNDTLLIILPDTLALGQGIAVQITWQSNSPYGIRLDAKGNMRVSLNSGTLPHWLPVLVHPRVAPTIDADFIIPENMMVIFNGTEGNEEALATGGKKVSWKFSKPLPVTDLSFAVGPFVKSEAIAGIKEIAVYSHPDFPTQQRESLLRTAVNSVRAMERKIGYEYPFPALHVVVLPDHGWEEKQAVSGLIYVYENLGSLQTQLKRGIAAQWLGAYHQFTDYFSHPHSYELLKAMLLNDKELEPLQNSDSLNSVSAWNRQFSGVFEAEDDFKIRLIEQNLSELITRKHGVLSWDDYAAFLYEQSGLYLKEVPLRIATETGGISDYKYLVKYDFDELNSNLILEFHALDGRGITTLADIEITQYTFSDTIQTTVSLTGLNDGAEMSLSPSVEYVTLKVLQPGNVQLLEYKPFMFLVNQLRSSDAGARKQAAEGLAEFTENPDLQLALRDALTREQHAEVKAAILTTLGQLLKGATGTEQTFLAVLNSADARIQKAALKALAGYPGNAEVASSLRNFILRAQQDSLLEEALRSYHAVSTAEEMQVLASRLKNEDETGLKSLVVLRVLAADTARQVLQDARDLMQPQYPYQIRKEALQLLLERQPESGFWHALLPGLLSDRDPRIRYLALDVLANLSPEAASEMLNNLEIEEYDVRVRAKIRQLNRP